MNEKVPLDVLPCSLHSRSRSLKHQSVPVNPSWLYMHRKLAESRQIPMEHQKWYREGRFSQGEESHQWESDNNWTNQMMWYFLLDEMMETCRYE